MACQNCFGTEFKRKIGRCKTCMWQLTVLSVIAWLLWFWLISGPHLAVNAIALLFFCCAFTGLLLLHWIVLAYRKLTGRP